MSETTAKLNKASLVYDNEQDNFLYLVLETQNEAGQLTIVQPCTPTPWK